MVRVPIVLALLLCGLTACSATQETDTASTDTMSVPTGPLDESDAKAVVDSMTEDMLQSRWLQQWEKEHEGRPTVTIGPIKNKNVQRIDEDKALIQPISRKLLNTVTVRVALETGQRVRAREERIRHHPRQSTPAGLAQELGADFMIQGTISSNIPENQSRDTVIIFYTINLELLNLESNRNAWLAEKEIKKIVDRSTASR